MHGPRNKIVCVLVAMFFEAQASYGKETRAGKDFAIGLFIGRYYYICQ
jgi:hypothetical protein